MNAGRSVKNLHYDGPGEPTVETVLGGLAVVRQEKVKGGKSSFSPELVQASDESVFVGLSAGAGHVR